jgi:citrate lyase subunit beta/citryl-CoA lyase
VIVRSWLYVPGDRPEIFRKAVEKGADAVVLDLEDAVSADKKQAARGFVADWVRDGDHGSAQVWVRVNQGALGLEDLRAVVGPGIFGVCLPKVDNVATVVDAVEVIEAAELQCGADRGAVAVVPLIESAVGLENLREIVRGPRVVQLQVGEVDLAGDLGLSGDVDQHLSPIRSAILVASVAAGISPPVGPVSTEFRNLEAFTESTRIVREQGFVGRACIHPDQVALVNAAFTPNAAEVEAAHSLLDRLAASIRDGSGIGIAEDGRMIDEASARAARRILELARSSIGHDPQPGRDGPGVEPEPS